MPPISKIRHSIAEHAARMVVRNESRTLNEAIRNASKRLGHKRLSADDRPNREDVQQQISILIEGTGKEQFVEQQRNRFVEAVQSIQRLIAPGELYFSKDFAEQWNQRDVIQLGFTVQCTVSCSLEEMEERICDADLKDVAVTLSDSHSFVHRIIQFGTIDFLIHDEDPSQNSKWVSANQLLKTRSDDSEFDIIKNLMQPKTAAILGQNTLPWVLLERLESIRWNTRDHPEGDMLYHSLQVFELGRNRFPVDLDFLEACLLHDVGFVIDPKNARISSAKAVSGFVSERTKELIQRLDEGHEYLLTGHASRGLRNSDLFDDLVDLARFDLEGRVRGATVLSLDEAHDFLSSTLDEWSD